MKIIRLKLEDAIYRDVRTLTMIDGDGGGVENYVKELLTRRTKELEKEIAELRQWVRDQQPQK